MDWVLLLGLVLLVGGAWTWFQQTRPASPLLYDDALTELYTTIQQLKLEMIKDNTASAVMPTPSKKMMLSYIYQGQHFENRTIYIHNISLTIPENAIQLLKWDTSTQEQIAEFICATLAPPASPTVHVADKSVLSINFILPDHEAHKAFTQQSIPNLVSLAPLKAASFDITLKDISTPYENVHTESASQNQSSEQVSGQSATG